MGTNTKSNKGQATEANKTLKIFNAINTMINRMQQAMDVFSNSLNRIPTAVASIKQSLGGIVTTFKNFVQNINQAHTGLNGVSKNMNAIKGVSKVAKPGMKIAGLGMNLAGGIVGGIGGIAANIGVGGVEAGAQAVDNYVNQNNKLSNINDGRQNQGQLQQSIYESAQRSHSSYGGMVDSVSNLATQAGGAFNGTNETVKFAELVNKSYQLSGASPEDSSAGMDVVTQSMSEGSVSADAFGSISQNAPAVAQAMANFTGKSTEELMKMAGEGKLSSDILKNSMLSAADSINSKYNQMPLTFGAVMTNLGNSITTKLAPVMQMISNLLNSEEGAAMIAGIEAVISGIAFVAEIFVGLIGNAFGVLFSNFNVIGGAIFSIMGSFSSLGINLYNIFFGVLNAIVQLIWRSFVEPILSIIEFILNVLNGGFDNVGEAVKNLVANMISWLLSLGKIVTTIVDAIFGTKWTDGLNQLQSNILKYGKNDKAITLDRKAPLVPEPKENVLKENLTKNNTNHLDLYNKGSKGVNNAATSAASADQTKYAAQTAANTGAMKNSMNASSEELKYLRDIAEQDVINRITTAEVKIEMTNNNSLSSDMDIDGVVSRLEDKVYEGMLIAAQGVY